MEVKDFLFQKYLDWQKETGKRQAQGKFAQYLGVPAASLSDWMNGLYFPKGAENLSKLAAKLGPEIYDVLGMSRPSGVRLARFDDLVDDLTDADVERLYNEAIQMAERNRQSRPRPAVK